MLETAQAEIAPPGRGPLTARATPHWTPEMMAVLACARAYLSPGSALPPLPPLDGERLLQEVGRHGLSTLMHRWLHDAQPALALPPEFRSALDERYRSYVRQGLQHTGVLVELMDRLRAAGLTALAYKGPALSSQLFDDPALREAVDLDILLPSDEVTTGCAVLTEAGFSPVRTYAPGIEKQLLRYRAEIGMMRDGVLVELQWRLAPLYFSVPIDVRAMATRARRVPVAGRELPVMSPEDMLLVLCVHGAKHHWQSLKWLLDVALLIGKHRELSWPTLRERARASGIERFLGLGLLLCETILQMPIPADTDDKIRLDEAILSAENEVLAGLASSRQPTEGEHHRLMLRLRERLADRVAYLFRLGWQPTESEWDSVSLPPRLQFGYHGVRVARVLAKALRVQSP